MTSQRALANIGCSRGDARHRSQRTSPTQGKTGCCRQFCLRTCAWQVLQCAGEQRPPGRTSAGSGRVPARQSRGGLRRVYGAQIAPSLKREARASSLTNGSSITQCTSATATDDFSRGTPLKCSLTPRPNLRTLFLFSSTVFPLPRFVVRRRSCLLFATGFTQDFPPRTDAGVWNGGARTQAGGPLARRGLGGQQNGDFCGTDIAIGTWHGELSGYIELFLSTAVATSSPCLLFQCGSTCMACDSIEGILRSRTRR